MINLRGRLVPLSLCLVAVAACSSSSTASARAAADPSMKQSVSVAPATPTPSPEPTTNAAIEAGLRAWLAAATVAFATGDTTQLVEHTEKTCACLSLVKAVHDAYAHGRIQGLTWTLHKLLGIDVNYHVATVQFSYDETSYQVVTNGKVSPTHYADRITVFSQFAIKKGEWRMWDYSKVSVVRL
jgi:hypothetical protein